MTAQVQVNDPEALLRLRLGEHTAETLAGIPPARIRELFTTASPSERNAVRFRLLLQLNEDQQAAIPQRFFVNESRLFEGASTSEIRDLPRWLRDRMGAISPRAATMLGTVERVKKRIWRGRLLKAIIFAGLILIGVLLRAMKII